MWTRPANSVVFFWHSHCRAKERIFRNGKKRSGLALTHFKRARSLLRRGQIGTVIIPDPAGAYEVEFADRDGRAFAILSLRPEQLMVLHDIPDFAAA
jgi:hypothetical protein